MADSLLALVMSEDPGYFEAKRRLTTGWVRRFVVPGLSDTFRMEGVPIALHWHRVKPSTNNGPGWRLTFECPWCRRRHARVLERIDGKGWRCCSCRHDSPEAARRRHRRKVRLARRRRLALQREQQAQG